MKGVRPSAGRDLAVLGKLAGTRARARARRSGPLLGLGASVVVLGWGLWSLGAAAPPRIEGAGGVFTIAMLVAGIVSFLAYGVLFGAADWRFLGGTGLDGGAIMAERSIRLVGVAVVSAVAITLPYGAGSGGWLLPLLVAVTAGLVSAGVASLTFALAARSIVDPAAGRVLGGGIRQFDPELARAAPLVYAPLLPFLAGTLAGGLPLIGWLYSPALATGAAAITLAVGARSFRTVAARFIPRIGEIARVPPSAPSELRRPVRRGVSILLPRAAAAVWRRDAVVLRRRFPWATRLAWPAAIASVVALARWGELDIARSWVVLAVGLVLLAQGAAVFGIGSLERRGCRWIDRSSGVPVHQRIIGRSACAFGTSVWLLIPVALAWRWWSGVPGAPGWFAAGGALALTAASASTIIAGR